MANTTTYHKTITAGTAAIAAAMGFYLAGAQLVPMFDTALRSIQAPVPVLWASAGLLLAGTPILAGIAGSWACRKLNRRRPKPVAVWKEQGSDGYLSASAGVAA